MRQTNGVSNELASAMSPYLQQHADNPVHWQEWGAAAFAEAQSRDVPIFLSVGYSACHWCHVMAHESFEDSATADFLNKHFVSIKVDREERPDVDAVYMDATTALTGRGGWPMSVFLDHAGKPFYAGTYFPPQPHHGLPSFMQVLEAISSAWRDRRDDVMQAAERITDALVQQSQGGESANAVPSETQLGEAVQLLVRQHDDQRGGFGRAPKFPPSMVVDFLLRHHSRTGDPESLRLVELTCTAMARGGMYDQLGGGFARYSVDDAWVVPHFEKMLYDNALLLRAYTRWWRVSRTPLAERVVADTVEFLLREMQTTEGGFAAALDADSEGHEGTFYVWSPRLLREVLSEDDAHWVEGLCEITAAGTFENGTSTVQLRRDPDDQDRWLRCRRELMAARDNRERPARDDKIVAAWNGMVIAALAEAGAAFDRPEWVAAAEMAGDLLVTTHLGADGRPDRLVRTSRDGVCGVAEAVLEDYACVADGFIRLGMTTGSSVWFDRAGVVLQVIVDHFGDGEGGFFDTADDADALIVRPRAPADGATPSGWSVAAQALLDYAAITGSSPHREVAGAALGFVAGVAAQAPRAAGAGLAAAEAWLDGPLEIAIIGDSTDPRTQALVAEVASGGALSTVYVQGSPDHDDAVPLLAGRRMVQGSPAAYVCRFFTCQRPVITVDDLRAALH